MFPLAEGVQYACMLVRVGRSTGSQKLNCCFATRYAQRQIQFSFCVRCCLFSFPGVSAEQCSAFSHGVVALLPPSPLLLAWAFAPSIRKPRREFANVRCTDPPSPIGCSAGRDRHV